MKYYFEPLPDLSLRIDKRENEIGKKFDDLQRQNRLLMAKILLMENEKILQDSNEIQVQQEQQKSQEIITKENVLMFQVLKLRLVKIPMFTLLNDEHLKD